MLLHKNYRVTGMKRLYEMRTCKLTKFYVCQARRSECTSALARLLSAVLPAMRQGLFYHLWRAISVMSVMTATNSRLLRAFTKGFMKKTIHTNRSIVRGLSSVRGRKIVRTGGGVAISRPGPDGRKLCMLVLWGPFVPRYLRSASGASLCGARTGWRSTWIILLQGVERWFGLDA